MTLQVGSIHFLVAAAYIIIFGFIWRMIAARYSETSLGKAMAFIY